MKIADLVERRQPQWQQLERLVEGIAKKRLRRADPEQILLLGRLYRAACADLALARSYRLPEETVLYLHQLVANAHNLVYRSEQFKIAAWGRVLFREVPARLLTDKAVLVSFFVFWFSFLGTMYLAYVHDDFARQVVGEETLERMEEMYAAPTLGRDADTGSAMTGFYIFHNAGIGLRCFASGVILGIGSLAALAFNGISLGTIFGHMAGGPQAANFFEFVTAHAPFELTAVVLSGGAGLRLGFSLIDTGGLSRWESLRQSARGAFEVAATATVLFFLAAFIEGFLSPSLLPYPFKAGVALASLLLLFLYVFVLGRRGAAHGD